jgi:MoaA/NifB/PqqE/SkfB family radical SAM enzyme
MWTSMNRINEFKRSMLTGYSLLRRKPAIVELPIFATNRCNSKCLTCNIWRKKPKTDLEPKIVNKILSSRVLSKSSGIILAGGEFILHPEYEKILSFLNKSGKNYILLSNGLLSDRLIDVVREFGVKNISLSLDGPPEIYRRIRGVDGYPHVRRVVEELRDDNVRINVAYTISPWNSRGDLLHVMDFCKKNALSLHVGYYSGIEYYDVKYAGSLYTVDDLIDHPYHRLYPMWVSGNLKMPCLTVFLRPVVRPNGDVYLCEPLQIKLGNLYEQDLEAIWHSQRTRILQKSNFSCNGCWHDSQRQGDIHAISTLAKYLVPPVVLNRIFGKSDWRRICKLIK